jgi:hypothetical protein
MTQSFPDDRPVIRRMSRYIVTHDGLRTMQLGELVLECGAANVSYWMPTYWSRNIPFARDAFADYCRKRGL